MPPRFPKDPTRPDSIPTEISKDFWERTELIAHTVGKRVNMRYDRKVRAIGGCHKKGVPGHKTNESCLVLRICKSYGEQKNGGR